MAKSKSKYRNDFEHFFHEELGYKILADEAQYDLVESILAPTDMVQGVFVDAPAGTGKTSISLSAAYYLLNKGDINRIIYVRNTVALRENGFLPGTAEEKEAQFMKPFMENINRIGAKIGHQDLFKDLLQQEQLLPVSTSYLRGVDIEEGALVVIDEAQNMDINELRTILTRVHDSVKVVMIGSHLQVDTVGLPRYGRKALLPFELYREHFKKQTDFVFEDIKLTTNYRGKLANFSDQIHNTIKEYKNEIKHKETEDEMRLEWSGDREEA